MEKIAKEIDNTYYSIFSDIEKRKNMINSLESKIHTLSEQEKELNISINVLKETQPEAINYINKVFKENNIKQEKRSSKKETIFFALGIIFTIVFEIAKNIISSLVNQ